MSTKSLLYIIGEPGIGKTTLLQTLLPVPLGLEERPVPHIRYPGGVQLGRWRGMFSGTDGMTRSIQPRVVQWLSEPDAPSFVVGEGDRLGNPSFFKSLLALEWRLTVVALVAPPSVVAQRHAGRGAAHQEKWLLGRQTKVRNLVRGGPGVLLLPATDLLQAAQQLARHPVIQHMYQKEELTDVSILPPEPECAGSPEAALLCPRRELADALRACSEELSRG